MIVDDIDEEDIAEHQAAPVGPTAPVAAPLELPSPIGHAFPQPPPEPELELTPAASAAELEEQVAELMGRDRQGAINMVRAVLCRCTPAEFEQIDVRALEAEAKRLQMEVKKQEKEAEKNAKRLAKIAEDEARRLQREADQEAKARQRLELAAQKKRQKLEQQPPPSAATREKVEASAAKKGFSVGMSVEAALASDRGLDGGGNGACNLAHGGRNYEGSWYAGTIRDIQRSAGSGLGVLRALVCFEPHEEMGFSISHQEMHELGGRDPDRTTDGDEVASRASSWLPLDVIRPAPPPRPPNFDSLLDPGQTLEVCLEGGWWEVELLGSSRDSPPPLPDPGRELAVGSQVSISKPDDTQYHGLCGTVAAIDGWVKVVFPEAQLMLREPPPRAEKHFRSSELELQISQISSSEIELAADGGDGAGPAAANEEATYVVRLLSAPTEHEGVYHVPLDRLRPGWQWRPNTLKWVGRWARHGDKQGKGARGGHGAASSGGARASAASIATEENGGGAQAPGLQGQPGGEQLRREWPLGKRVEVQQQDEGYEGSWYAGTVAGYDPPLVVVRYDELFESNDSDQDEPPEQGPAKLSPGNGAGVDAGSPSQAVDLAPEHPDGLPHLVNPEALKQMRPEPPAMSSAEHAVWAAALQPGAALDLSFDGGFWDVELVSIRDEAQTSGPPLRQLVVRALQFDAEHTVGSELLRPPHVWDAQRHAWSSRPPPGVHVPAATSSAPRARKRPRADADAQGPEGQGQGAPREKASHFALGTRRKGRDGRLWEVDTGPGANDIWVPCERGPPQSTTLPSPSPASAAAASAAAATPTITAAANGQPAPAPTIAIAAATLATAPPVESGAATSQSDGAAAQSATPAPVADARTATPPPASPACDANGG